MKPGALPGWRDFWNWIFFSLRSSFIFTWNDFTRNQLPFLGCYKVTSTFLSEDRLPSQKT